MLTVCRKFSFDSAHYLPNYKGKCSNLHGHRWTMEVELDGLIQTEGSEKGMIMDFSFLKEIVEREVVSVLDHHCLNDTGLFDDPTAENITLWISKTLQRFIPTLVRIRLYESPESFAEWRK